MPSPTKKRKTDHEQNEKTEKSPPPPYGSRAYWDARYKKHRSVPEGVGEDAESGDKDILSDNDALPYHAWYFTYDDLRPLILPLILGGRDEAMGIMVDNMQRDENVQEEATDDHDITEEDSEVKNENNKSDGDTKPAEKSPGDESETYEDEEGELDGAKSDDEEEELEEREGLAKDGPISVLEVGCGDVPLGKDLAMELDELELKTGAKAENVVKRIVCCDYSESVIEMLKSLMAHSGKERQASRKELAETKEEGKGENHGKSSDNVLEYVVADARKLPYSDGEFELVLEKGTLDAMLSDTEIGVTNCVLIVTECARVLAIGGYFVIVSHLNAHTTSGLGWLDEVVVPGLRAGGGNATWEIEVHGNDGCEGEVESDEEGPAGNDKEADNSARASTKVVDDENNNRSESPRPPSGSPGPALYIIHKKEPQTEQRQSGSGEPPTIPLKFFGY